MPAVLLLCEYPTLNGGEQSMLATLPGLVAADYTPTVLCPGAGPLADALRARGIETVPFACHGPDGVRLSQVRLREDLTHVLRQLRPQLLHANSLSMGRLAGPVTQTLGIPSITHVRDIVKLSAQAAADVNCHRRILAVSEAVRTFHVAHGLAAAQTAVLYNGVDLERFRPRPATGALHRELGLSDDALLIGTIGQLSLRKGQDVLLQAAQTVAQQLPAVHFVLVGVRHSQKAESCQFEAQLRAEAATALPGRVHFLGVRDDVPHLLTEFAMLVHPARQEPLGRVLLEAAAAGVAVIATDVGGTREIFPADTAAAELIPPADAGTLAAAILKLACDPAARRQLAAAARQRAEQRFDIRAAVASLVQHYRAIV